MSDARHRRRTFLALCGHPNIWVAGLPAACKDGAMLFTFDGYQLDEDRRLLAGPSGEVHLEPQVYALLHYLLVHHQRVVPKEELLDELWGDRFVSESALTTRVKAARRAVGDDGRSQRMIRTVHGIGYRFVCDLSVHAPPPPVLAGQRSFARARVRLIGRDADVAAAHESVERHRLTTIVGPGGVGKTSLSLTVAHDEMATWPDGVVFADLVPARGPLDVVRAIAEAAGVEGDASYTAAGLAAHLTSRRMLLFLDNCEHVLEPVSDFLRLLLGRSGACHVVATSRVPIGLVDEQVLPLDPLGPDAAELFVERARASEPRVVWDASDTVVIDICRRLDGLPLAIELAAGQLRRWGIDELSRRLQLSDDLLRTRPDRRDDRHETMRATIDWSYQLLDDGEQRLLRHLAAFPASFGLDAVASLSALLADVSLDITLAELVDKSMVVRDPGSSRYRLLETIRAFALDQLDAHGERRAAFEAHRSWFVGGAGRHRRLDWWLSAQLAAEARSQALDARQAFWASLDAGQVADAVQVAMTRSFLWRQAIGCAEGMRWIEALQDRELDHVDNGWVHVLRSDVGQGIGDFRLMVGAADDALSPLHPPDPTVTSIATHFAALRHLTHPDHAKDSFAALGEQVGEPRLANLFHAFAIVAELIEPLPTELEYRLERLHRTCSADGYDRFILNWAGWLRALILRDGPAARRWIGYQHDLLHATGLIETWHTSLSTALAQLIDGATGDEYLANALDIANREGYRIDGDYYLALAYAQSCRGEHVVAAELLGQAQALKFNATAHYVLHHVAIAPGIRSRLPAAEFEAAIRRGRARAADASPQSP